MRVFWFKVRFGFWILIWRVLCLPPGNYKVERLEIGVMLNYLEIYYWILEVGGKRIDRKDQD